MIPGDRVRVRPSARGTSLGGYFGTVTDVASNGVFLVLLDGDARPLRFGERLLEPAAQALADALRDVTGECTEPNLTGAE